MSWIWNNMNMLWILKWIISWIWNNMNMLWILTWICLDHNVNYRKFWTGNDHTFIKIRNTVYPSVYI